MTTVALILIVVGIVLMVGGALSVLRAQRRADIVKPPAPDDVAHLEGGRPR